MIELWRSFIRALLHDPLAVKRWSRAFLFTASGSGLAFSHDIAEALGRPALEGKLKAAAVVAGFLAGAVTAGEKNLPPEVKP